MRVRITGLNAQKKIQAIKAIRFVTGLGLKEAKYIADDVASGSPQVISARDDVNVALELATGEVTYRVDVPLAEFVTALSEYPAGMRVGDLVRTLSVVRGDAA